MTHIHRMVEYDKSLDGYVYQIAADTPLRGPFATRESAVADALFNEADKEEPDHA